MLEMFTDFLNWILSFEGDDKFIVLGILLVLVVILFKIGKALIKKIF